MSRKKEITDADMTVILEEYMALGWVVCIDGVWHPRANLPAFKVTTDNDKMLDGFDEAFMVDEGEDDE